MVIHLLFTGPHNYGNDFENELRHNAIIDILNGLEPITLPIRSICGINHYQNKIYSTSDLSKVTCKRCLEIIQK